MVQPETWAACPFFSLSQHVVRGPIAALLHRPAPRLPFAHICSYMHTLWCHLYRHFTSSFRNNSDGAKLSHNFLHCLTLHPYFACGLTPYWGCRIAPYGVWAVRSMMWHHICQTRTNKPTHTPSVHRWIVTESPTGTHINVEWCVLASQDKGAVFNMFKWLVSAGIIDSDFKAEQSQGIIYLATYILLYLPYISLAWGSL